MELQDSDRDIPRDAPSATKATTWVERRQALPPAQSSACLRVSVSSGASPLGPRDFDAQLFR